MATTIVPSLTIRATFDGYTLHILGSGKSDESLEHSTYDRSDLQCGCERSSGSIHKCQSSSSYEQWKAMGLYSLLGT